MKLYQRASIVGVLVTAALAWTAYDNLSKYFGRHELEGMEHLGKAAVQAEEFAPVLPDSALLIAENSIADTRRLSDENRQNPDLAVLAEQAAGIRSSKPEMSADYSKKVQELSEEMRRTADYNSRNLANLVWGGTAALLTLLCGATSFISWKLEKPVDNAITLR